MSKSTKSAITTLALALTILVGRGIADEVKNPLTPEEAAKAFAEASQPGAEHKKLNALIGSWSYTCKCWMEPGKDPIVMTGTIDRKWILGGRFIEEKCVGTGFDGKPGFEGRGTIGYDKSLQKYTMSWICNSGTGTSTGLGTSQSPGTFEFQSTCSCPLEKGPITGRDVIRVVSKNKIVMESFKSVGGKEMKVMEIVSTRK